MIDKNNIDAIENTSNNKYLDLFENPTYSKIQEYKKEKKKSNEKVLTKEKKNNSGFASPIILGALICLLTLIGMILSHITYLIS